MTKQYFLTFALAAIGSVGITACGGDSTPAVDAAPGVDAAAATVMAVDCASATPTATVTDPGFKYVSTPAGAAANDSAIAVGDVVEFNLVPAMNHPVGPDPGAGMTDPGIVALDNKVTCLKFTATGTFHYQCSVHTFKGTVTVH